jgi:hypothetical protein
MLSSQPLPPTCHWFSAPVGYPVFNSEKKLTRERIEGFNLMVIV